MSHRHRPKFYTVEEARALVPRLRDILTTIQSEKHMLEMEVERLTELSPVARTNGHAAEASRLEQRIESLAQSIEQHLTEITSLDIEVKDIDTGLIDFLSLRDEQVVYLCWKIDEPTVAYWHPIDTGFRGRQPLDE